MKEKIRNAILNHQIAFQGDGFNDLALELWAWQIQHNPEYGRFCGEKRPRSWLEIPAVPVTLFRDLLLTSFPPIASRHIFQTSGTTGPRGKIHLMDTDVYDLGAVVGRDILIGAVPTTGLSLVSPAFDSSLGHMSRLFAPTMLQAFSLDDGVLQQEAWDYLRSATEPIFIPTTSFALFALIQDIDEPCLLPDGSVMMVTGGFKGHHHKINAATFIQKIHFLFPTLRIVGEYGMSELCSQFWSKELGRHFYPPPWLRAYAVDPKTGKRTTGIGQLRFVDLANHQTVLAIETRDQGIVHSDGSVELLGRLPKAELRGCSLSVEEVDQNYQQPISVFQHQKRTPPKEHNHAEKITEVVHALQKLKQIDPTDISESLSSENADWGWNTALNAITEKGLQTLLATNPRRPAMISIIIARGVFTSAIEWIALALASGAAVHLKSPSSFTKTADFLADFFQQEGFVITSSASRNLPQSDLIYAFGSDESLKRLAIQYPNTPIKGYGHRFSLIVCGDSEEEAITAAKDFVAYDGRGCMAPVGVCCFGNAEQFSRYLLQALRAWEQERPLGEIDPYLFPEIRRRLGLARIKGQVYQAEKSAVFQLPLRYFYPSSLPRIATVYAIQTEDQLAKILTPWRANLSSLASSIASTKIAALFPRVVALGKLQEPVFPRKHDGVSMWIE